MVVGAAYGSEGKGHITAQLVKQRLTQGMDVLNIRVAGPNAGHTVIDVDGNSFPLRQVPVGMAVSDSVVGYISPGSEIELPVLISEIELLREHGHAVRSLFVSGEATLITDSHKQREAGEQLTERVGSTGKGIGAARADRLMRTAVRLKDDEYAQHALANLGVKIVDRPEPSLAYDWLTLNHCAVIVEGTQGYGLGLHAGYYPQTTSSDCRAIDFLAMAGISPWQEGIRAFNVWLVARVFPIRVAGNSGPMLGETSWEELGLPEEKTTVTHKVRRVGQWDPDLIREAVKANGGGQSNTRVQVQIALTMVDQKFPGIKGMRNLHGYLLNADKKEQAEVRAFFEKVAQDAGARIGVVATSPTSVMWIGQ